MGGAEVRRVSGLRETRMRTEFLTRVAQKGLGTDA